MKFTNIDMAILIGLIIGDGYIDPKGRIEVCHCEKLKDYCIFKAALLHSVCGGKDIKVHKEEYIRSERTDDKEWKNKLDIKYRFRKQSVLFKFLRNLIYGPDGKKRITTEILQYFSPLTIALWWLDDGNLTKKKERDGSRKYYKLLFYTYLSKESNELLRLYFLDNYGMEWNVVPANIYKEDQYMLRCGQREGKKFLNIIREFVQTKIPSMQYKVLDI